MFKVLLKHAFYFKESDTEKHFKLPYTYGSSQGSGQWAMSSKRSPWLQMRRLIKKKNYIYFEINYLISVQIIFIPVHLFATPWACQAPLSMEFSRPEYWRGQSFSYSGGLPNPGIEPKPPALQADSLLSEPPGKPLKQHQYSFLLMNLHLGPFWVGQLTSAALCDSWGSWKVRGGETCVGQYIHTWQGKLRRCQQISAGTTGDVWASFPLSAWLLHMVSPAWWLQRSQSSYKSVLDFRGIRKKSKPSESCIAFYNLNSHMSFPL